MISPIISDIHAREILDSRGNPTIEVDIICEGEMLGRASVPSGASTGEYEALELRDGDKNRYNGKGVLKSIKNIHDIIRPSLLGKNILNQRENDLSLIEQDGTKDKSKLGANSILGVSLALAHSGAKYCGLPFYRYLGGSQAFHMPVPLMNIVNGGQHSNNNIDFQEFMIVPHGFTSFQEALRAGVEIFHSLKKLLIADGLSTAVGDEGGFAPSLSSNRVVIEMILRAVENADYRPDEQVSLAIDVASSEFYDSDRKLYVLSGEDIEQTSEELIDIYVKLCRHYPIVSIEDGLDENDWEGWASLTKKLGSTIQLVGDDLLVTNIEHLKRAIESNVANAILIKPNQIGTITETMEAIELAKRNSYKTIISHRSGETESTSISHIAVASNAGQIKTGSLSRTDRLIKYNELLRIEEGLGSSAYYPGKNAL